MKLNELTIAEARRLLASGQGTAVGLTKACLERLKAVNEKLNACLLIDEVKALAAAEAADQRLAAGEQGSLLGVPYLIKDNILAKGWRTTAASRMLADYVAPYDATVVARLNAAGAVLLGKTNLDEFAHGASTETSWFGPTKNPWDLTRVPGGSSGGSAAAVATDCCLFALGTDTGGSVRHPAAFCGTIGFKPSYGLCSRYGLIAMTSSTDVPGVLAKSAADAQLILSETAGWDARDSTTVAEPLAMATEQVWSTLRVGVVKEFQDAAVSSAVRQAYDRALSLLREQGAEIKEIALPHALYGVSVYYLLTPSEISSNLARFDGLRYGLKGEGEDLLADYSQSRGQGFGAEVKRRIMLGTFALSAGYYDAYYLKAQQVRTLIINDFQHAFKQVDVIVSPTTPTTAFKLGEQINDPLKMYLEDIFLTPASLAGLPAVNVPAGVVDGLPVGVQLTGRRFKDNQLLTVAEQLGQLLMPTRLHPRL